MKEYQVEIKEWSSKNITVKADSQEEAEQIAERKYYDDDYIFGRRDVDYTEFSAKLKERDRDSR